jgi:phospholipid transport system substrate-binding protein
MKTKQLALAACFILSILIHPAYAGEPTERVRALLDEVISIQTDPRYEGEKFREQRGALIKEAIDRNFAFDRMAERALSGYWKNLGPEEQAEFKGIFRDLFQDAYSFMVLENLGEERILYQDEDVRQGSAVVKTIMFRRNATLSVDYDLSEAKGPWLIQDVRIDGVSILRNYQESFASVIRRDSYGKLIEKMHAKRKEIEKSP